MAKFKKVHNTPVFWIVLSPEYECTYGDYYEPPEWTRDVLFVRAKTAHQAKVLAIRAWRRGWGKMGLRRWGQKQICRHKPYIIDYNDENPMAVLTVHRSLLTGGINARVL